MTTESKYSILTRTISIVSMVLVFLFSIELMGEAFKSLGVDVAESILLATSNPFIGLFIGLLATALIQSSSTITTMVVAIVASGSLSLPEAIPIIMGANIGTTLTSTLVSLAYINKREEFKRAIAAGTIHDFFNILTIFILFPLEYKYGFVSWLSQSITGWLVPNSRGIVEGHGGFKLFEILPGADRLAGFIDNPIITIILSFLLLFGSIKILANFISKMLMGEEQDKLKLFIFDSTYLSFGWGMLLTGMVQSSSITTSLVVPFAATGKLSLNKVTPFILGANIGTTITAFIAVFFQSEIVISIAVTHLIINVIGVLIFLPLKFMRNGLTRLSEIFGELTMRFRVAGFVYIILVFFLIPFTLIYSNQGTADVRELTYEIKKEDGTTEKEMVIAKIARDKKMPAWLMQTGSGKRGEFNIQDVVRTNNVLFIDDTFYLIQQPGHCWDDEKDSGRFKVCVSAIMPKMNINKQVSVDSVYVYTKEYDQPFHVDSVSYRYYISVPEKILVRMEKLDPDGTILLSRQLVDLKD